MPKADRHGMLQQSKNALKSKTNNTKHAEALTRAFTRKYSRPIDFPQSSLCRNPCECDAVCSMLHLEENTFLCCTCTGGYGGSSDCS